MAHWISPRDVVWTPTSQFFRSHPRFHINMDLTTLYPHAHCHGLNREYAQAYLHGEHPTLADGGGGGGHQQAVEAG